MEKLKTIDTREMTREEWEAARRQSIGGSDAATVLGLNEYSSPYALWAEKTGKVIPEDISGKESVRLGRDLEDYVAHRFMEQSGKKVIRKNAILINPKYPWAHANVDRLVVGVDAGLECKTTSTLSLKHYKHGDFPARFYCQCMHYLAVTGRQKWYLAVLVLGRDFLVFKIERDEEEIAALMEAEKNFWHLVETDTPPAMSGMDTDDETLTAIYPESDGTSIDLFGMGSTLEAIATYDEHIKALAKERDALRQQVQSIMGAAESGVTDGWRVSWKSQTRTSYDYKAIERDHPGLLAPYAKMTSSRVFRTRKVEAADAGRG